MNALKKLIALLCLVSISTGAVATTDAEVFAYAEANFPSIFVGTAASGQITYLGMQYNYRYYSASGNYLAVDTANVISILGPFTGGVLTAVGPVTAYTNAIETWKATSIAYSITAHGVSDSCRLPEDQVINGVLTPASQAGSYTTLFVDNTAIALTVPGSNTLVFSFPDGGGTTTENMQIAFDLSSHSVTGSSHWTNSNGLGCFGDMTFSGSWGSAAAESTYPIPVSVIGSTGRVSNVQICATISGNETCGPSGGYAVGQSGTISVSAASGLSYVIHVPSNQPAASFCSVTSGGSGVLGSSLPTAVVTCQ